MASTSLVTAITENVIISLAVVKVIISSCHPSFGSDCRLTIKTGRLPLFGSGCRWAALTGRCLAWRSMVELPCRMPRLALYG